MRQFKITDMYTVLLVVSNSSQPWPLSAKQECIRRKLDEITDSKEIWNSQDRNKNVSRTFSSLEVLTSPPWSASFNRTQILQLLGERVSLLNQPARVTIADRTELWRSSLYIMGYLAEKKQFSTRQSPKKCLY